MHPCRDKHDRDQRSHARPLCTRIDALCKYEIAAVRKIDKQQKKKSYPDRRQHAHRRLDIVPRLVPVREIQRHERGGTERMPDRHIVGDLREWNECHEKAEHREQRRGQSFASEVKENAAERGEHEHICRSDEEVKEDERAIPVPPIRPCVEQREGQAPEQPRHHRPDHPAREKGYARPILHEHENPEDRKERGKKILRAHILPYIDIACDKCQKIRPCRRRIADPLVRPLR